MDFPFHASCFCQAEVFAPEPKDVLMLSSKTLGFTFKFVIHFELVFV